MNTPSTASVAGGASAAASPAASGGITSGASMQSGISTPAAPVGGGASACTIAPLTPSEQQLITIRSALLLGRLLSISAFQAGLISRAEMDAHADAFSDAELALGRER